MGASGAEWVYDLAMLSRMSALTCLALLAPLVAGCDTRDDFWDGEEPVDLFCRQDPRACFGEVGGGCVVLDDCTDGVCCHDSHCGPGLCLYLCRSDYDCPPETLCEDGYCFLRCSRDDECGPGMSCEHGHTVCEYPD